MMSSPLTARLCAAAVSSLAVLSAACTDELEVDRAPAMTQPVGVTAEAVRARARILETNRHAWVGTAHNEALQQLKWDIAAPGSARSLCRAIADFASRAERIPAPQRAGKLPNLSELRSELEVTLCKASRRGARARHVVMHSAPAPSAILDAPTSLLLNAVETAIQDANDSYDLAARLDPILAASTSLDTIGRAAVEVAVSLAQSSVENAVAELPNYVNVVRNEYGTCAESYRSDGYGLDDVEYLCTEGKDREYEMFNPVTPRARVHYVGVLLGTTAKRCVGLGAGWKRVGSVDLKSGIAGFIGGLIKTKSIGGAGLYALGSSVGGSGAEYLHVAWDMWWCAMT